jgi:uncharacterized repeat protein (TIGR01451 family)
MKIKFLLQKINIVKAIKQITLSSILFSSVCAHAQMITTYAGNGSQGITGDGGAATSAKLSFAFATAVDASGNLYIGMPDAIRKVSPGGTITAFAGNGTAGYTGDGGQATSAEVANVRGLAVDAAGNVYMADQFFAVIRKIDVTGIITTIAGTGSRGFSGDGGPATAAQLDQMGHIAVDASGNLFIADSWNGRIRRVDGTTGIITTVAGVGTPGSQGYSGDGGPATSAQFANPSGITIAANGDLYIADEVNNCIRKIDKISGIVTTVAGIGGPTNYGYNGDGGLATAAYLHQPTEVVFDASGNMIIADAQNHCIRKVNGSGIITTIAGNGAAGFLGDGNIPSNAQFNEPYSISINTSGNLFIADVNNFRIRKIDFSATPVCPYNLTLAKTLGANGLLTVTPSITPASSSPTYFGSVSGNPLSNPMITNNFTITTSYSLTLPGNGIYNIAITYDDTIAPYHCIAYLNDTVLINNSSAPRTFNRRFTLSNLYSCNSNSTDTVYFTDSTRFNYSLTNPSATYTIVTNWGNGSVVTNTVSATNQIMLTSASIVYGSPGVYTVQSIIMGAGIANDTAVQFVNVQQCGNLTGWLYNDINNDCAQGSGEFNINTNIALQASDGINIYQTWNTGGMYAFTNLPAGTYTVQVLSGITGYSITCPGSMSHTVTITAMATYYEYYALNCSGGFDIATTGISLLNGFYPGQTDMVLPHVGILNGTCDFVVAGTVKMILTPCIQYVAGGSYSHAPDAIIPAATGDTLVWNVADINTIGNFGYWDYGVSVTTCTNAVVGDTACITMMVLPTNGDVDMSNNTFTRCFAIGVSYDPNYKEVTPKGNGAQGFIPATTNDLTYTLHFQNTGTAKAFNIALLDTISANLDLTSIEIISSSHAVQPYLLSGRTMKFMFSNINLPDSTSDEKHSHGYVTYRIKLNTGLAPATQIKNTGYIYFDYNSPVVTNTTLNTISPSAGITPVHSDDALNLYPNPSNGDVFLSKTVKHLEVYDMKGSLVENYSNSSKISAEHFTEGIYFIRAIEENGKISSFKLVKIK